jgi:AraC-like DNA-binding protein
MLTSLTEVLWTARYDYQPHWRLERHHHNYFQMIYFLSGSGCFFMEDKEYPLSQDMVFLIKPHQMHGLSALSAVKTLDIKFIVNDPHLKRSLMRTRPFVVEKDSAIPHLFEKIRWEGEHKGYLFRDLCRNYLMQMLILYLRRDGGNAMSQGPVEEGRDGLPENDTLIRRAIELIKSQYAEYLGLRAMARHLGVSDRHLRARFKESVGVSPIRYLVRYRVEMAKNLISYSDYALKVVAELVGFKNIHHFTRVFHEATGETPGAWRRKYHEGICKDVCIDPHFSNVILTAREDESSAGFMRPTEQRASPSAPRLT